MCMSSSLFLFLSMLVIMVMLMALMMAGDKPNEHLVLCKILLNFLMGNQIPQAECNKQNLSHERIIRLSGNRLVICDDHVFVSSPKLWLLPLASNGW